jgi:DNA-binding PadR family transcriptional regulator
MFWDASLPQIYRTLHQMERNGWVISNVEQQKGKPNRKIYKITSKGKKELYNWLGEPFEAVRVKSEMMIKVFFGNQMDRGNLVKHINDWRKEHKKFLEVNENGLKQIVQRYATELDAKDDMGFWLLTVDLGIRRSKMIVAWCDSALEFLKK